MQSAYVCTVVVGGVGVHPVILGGWVMEPSMFDDDVAVFCVFRSTNRKNPIAPEKIVREKRKKKRDDENWK